MVTLSNDEMKCIELFESQTGAIVKDCLIGEEGIAFVIKEGEMGRAIGKGGSSLERARKAFGKPLFVVESADDIKDFVVNLLKPVPISNLNIQEKDNTRTAIVTVDARDRGAAIGKGGERIKMEKALLRRRFNADLRLATKD
ncbi:KH domain protein [Candidatus Burarchaeum australiense]|nr:KH domain protein [Candidatus Burarchaeum australiense]